MENIHTPKRGGRADLGGGVWQEITKIFLACHIYIKLTEYRQNCFYVAM